MMALQQGTPARRALVVNVMVLAAVFVVLAVSPAPVSFPESAWETALLTIGAVALLLVNALVFPTPRTASRAPLTAHMPPDDRVLEEFLACVDYEIIDADETAGIVSEVLVTRDGVILGLAVQHGLLRMRRYVVTLDQIHSFDHAARTIYLRPSPSYANAINPVPKEER